MEIDSQHVINDLLEQVKQLSFQLSVARCTITQLEAQLAEDDESSKKA